MTALIGRKLNRTQPAWSRSEARPEGQSLLVTAQTMESETRTSSWAWTLPTTVQPVRMSGAPPGVEKVDSLGRGVGDIVEGRGVENGVGEGHGGEIGRSEWRRGWRGWIEW